MASVQEAAVENDITLKRAFVVVGMHRSGTSAMTRTLSLLGAALPQGLMPAVDNNNESGFWEPQSVADLNDEILEALDSEWDDVFSFRPREYLSNFDRFYLGRAVELLDQEFNGSEVIALKDPRISILTTFWERALREAGYATHYVVMVRNPLEVAESLRARDGFPREKSLLLWSSYMIAADRDTRDHSRIFVSYDQLMNDWREVCRRIEGSAGFPFPRDTARAANEIDRFLDRRFRHFGNLDADIFSRSDVPDEVKTLYRIFKGACEGVDIDRAELDAVQRELDKMDVLVGPLLADLRSRVRTLASEVNSLSGAQAEAAQRAETLEQELAAERTIRGQAIDAVQEARNEAAAKDAERERLTTELGMKERQAAELERRLADIAVEMEKERSSARAARDAQSRREAGLAAELESERAAARAARDAQSRREAELAAELENERAAVRAARDAQSRREAELTAELKQRGEEIADLNRKLRDSRSEAESVRRALRDQEKTFGKALDEVRAENEAVQARLDGRFRELAALTNLLVEAEAQARQSREEADWLRQAASVLLPGQTGGKGRLMRLMPAAVHVRRQLKQLRRKGIFDGDAYLAANPDVAADGADPLKHYLSHGLSENRRRG